MKVFLLLVLVVKKNVLVQSHGCRTHIDVKVNTRLNGNSIGMFDVNSMQQCARMCLSFSVCKSFDFHRSLEHNCKLNNVNSSSIQNSAFQNVAGWVYSDIISWPMELAGGCSKRQCQYNEMCMSTGLNYICKRIDCGKPPSVVNGVVENTTTNSTFGAVFKVFCLSGYRRITEQSIIRCKASGQWDDPDPECIPIDCGDPEIEHGVYNKDITTFGTNVTVDCSPGYVLNGNSVITCQHDGSWSILPQCHPVDCGDPEIEFGVYDKEKTTYGTNISVECSPGYIINGSDVITCQHDVKWSSLPKCDPVDCKDPGIRNAIYNDTATVYNTVLNVSCEDAYIINGDEIITCLVNGTWNALPSCLLDVCLSCYAHVSNMYLHNYVDYPHEELQSISSAESCIQTCDAQYQPLKLVGYNNLVCICCGFTWSEYLDAGNGVVFGPYTWYQIV